MNPLVWIFIVLFIFTGSHLTVDDDFPSNIKTIAMVVMIVVALIYLVVGIIL